MKPFLDRPPIGFDLHRTARLLAQAFDAALADEGGTLPVWLTLLAVKAQRSANQRELASSIGIRGATLTHHLNGMEAQGLLTRHRDPDNRRMHRVTLTPAGETLFRKLRGAAVAFDMRLRGGLPDEKLADLTHMLAVLRANIDS